MLIVILALVFFCVFTLLINAFALIKVNKRPTLDILESEIPQDERKNKISLLGTLAFFNAPLCLGPLGERMRRDLVVARVNFPPEAFLLIKEICIVAVLLLTFPMSSADSRLMWFIAMFALGFYLPEFWLKMKIQKVKNSIVRDLPDAIDLLSLCVNAGLDFLLALKWVVEKSAPSILILELRQVMQEVHVGKPRRDALNDFSNKYQIPDLSTFTRALVQADRMGTSVAEALNIISEDMRISRFRRGEQIALKAPLKMLIPLLFCIFPVVGILVAGPVLLQFMQGSITQIGGG
ncbi:MAG: type II secretion system F family protein [Candidatus Omnitrophica bacterium]|nr:type II secretion system F family protein [Candidatus Omnitrophota bacterium]